MTADTHDVAAPHGVNCRLWQLRFHTRCSVVVASPRARSRLESRPWPPRFLACPF